jgi:large subunit ribosomal protein L15
MQINTLKIKYRKKKRKTVGRGGKKGTYSGRGGKGQSARSGFSMNPLFEGGRSSLIDRMKKIRGFKSAKPKAKIIKFNELEKISKNDDIINREYLLEVGLLRKKERWSRVKILGSGNLKHKLEISKEIRLSGSAKKSLEKSGEKTQSKARKK